MTAVLAVDKGAGTTGTSGAMPVSTVYRAAAAAGSQRKSVEFSMSPRLTQLFKEHTLLRVNIHTKDPNLSDAERQELLGLWHTCPEEVCMLSFTVTKSRSAETRQLIFSDVFDQSIIRRGKYFFLRRDLERVKDIIASAIRFQLEPGAVTFTVSDRGLLRSWLRKASDMPRAQVGAFTNEDIMDIIRHAEGMQVDARKEIGRFASAGGIFRSVRRGAAT